MTNYFDDDSFWDDRANEATSQISRVNRRIPERTRSHHVVKRDVTHQPTRDEDEDMMWLEPVARTSERLGAFGNIDPRLLSVGAIALAAILAVPLFGALGGDGGGDDAFRTVAEAQQTTTSTAATTTTVSPEIVITAAVNPVESDSAEPDSSTSNNGDSGSSSSSGDSASAGQSAVAPAALRAPAGCSNTYEVAAGDFWVGIAEKADVSLADLLAANDATAETMLFPGSDMCLPSGSSIGGAGGGGGSGTVATVPATCAIDYEVKAGEFWVSIADSAGVSLADLLAANNATKDTAIFPGSDICLPAGATAPTPSTPTTAAPITQPATTEPPTTVPHTTEPATTEPSTTEVRVTNPPPSGGQVEQMIRDVWPDDLEEDALRIAWRESNYRPDVTSSTGCCVGVFQMHWEAHRGWLSELGITSRDQLFDARTNIEAAYALYQRNGGWGPWAL